MNFETKYLEIYCYPSDITYGIFQVIDIFVLSVLFENKYLGYFTNNEYFTKVSAISRVFFKDMISQKIREDRKKHYTHTSNFKFKRVSRLLIITLLSIA